MKNIFYALILSLTLVLFGCPTPVSTLQGSGGTGTTTTGGTTTTPSAKTAGQFSVQRLSGSNPTARNVSIGSVTVDSSNFVLFILKNNGGADISNIALTVTGANIATGDFTVTPGTITSISPSSSATIDTLIRVDINHGLLYGKVGTTNYINPAVTTATIHITGTTVDPSNGAVLPVTVDADLTTLIDLASWSITSSQGAGVIKRSPYLDSGLTTGYYTGSGGASTPITLTITNTGNVPLTVIDLGTASTPVGGAVLPKSGDKVTIIVPTNSNASFSVDTGGTVFDNRKTGGAYPGLQFLAGNSTVDIVVQP